MTSHALIGAPAPRVTLLSGGIANLLAGEWPDRSFPAVTRAELHSFTVARPRAMALVCVGGGYTSLVYDKEGVEVALWLNRLGIDAHVLVHRLPGAPDGEGGVFAKGVALADGLAALDHIATTDGAALPLLLFGLSSGGHLAATLACQKHRLSPRGVIATYAPLNANHRQHKVPAGKPDYPPVEKQDFYDDWPIGLAGHEHGIPPIPMLLVYALTDPQVPVQHALRLIETAARLGLDLDAHIYGQAPHGFALRERTGSHALWPEIAADWIDRHL